MKQFKVGDMVMLVGTTCFIGRIDSVWGIRYGVMWFYPWERGPHFYYGGKMLRHAPPLVQLAHAACDE